MNVEEVLEKIIREKTKSTECLICNVKIGHINMIYGHYHSEKHIKNVAKYRAVYLIGALLKSKCKVPLVYQKPEQKQETSVPQTTAITCDVCKISLGSKLLKESHIKEFPHVDLIELKRDLMRRGCSTDYYSICHNSEYIYCALCQIVLQNGFSAKSHNESAAHQKKFNLKFVEPELIPEHISKWYYCKLCDKDLDGTSDANKHNHYITPQTRTSIPSGNVQANAVKSTSPEATTIVSTKPTNLPGTSTRTILSPGPDPNTPLLFPDTKSKSDSKTSSDLRGQIFNELEKLVQTLYYSNKVPEEVALDYVKKVNREVKTIIDNHAKPEFVKTTNAANGVVPKAKTVNDVVSTNEINETETKEVKQPAKAKLPSPEKAVNVQVSKQETKIVASSTQPTTPFSNLLTEIVDEKHRLQKAGIQTNVTKLEVIGEIEILLLQVSEPKLPLQEILDCLEKFNQIIALDCVKKQSSQPCSGM